MSSSRDDFGIAIRSALLKKGARQKFSLIFLLILAIIIFLLDSYQFKFIKFSRILINDGIYRISNISTAPLKLILLMIKLRKLLLRLKKIRNLK